MQHESFAEELARAVNMVRHACREVQIAVHLIKEQRHPQAEKLLRELHEVLVRAVAKLERIGL